MTDTTIVAYLAGFFDGEGCVTSMKYQGGSVGLRTQLSQNDQRPLDLAMQTFPGGRLYPRAASKVLNVQWHGLVAADMLEAMLPYLIVKKDEARLGIEFGNIMRRKTAANRYTPEDYNRLRVIRQELKDAKRG